MPAYSCKVLVFKFSSDHLTPKMKALLLSILGLGLFLLPLVAAQDDLCEKKKFYIDQVCLLVNSQNLARLLIHAISARGSSAAVLCGIILAMTKRRPSATVGVCVVYS